MKMMRMIVFVLKMQTLYSVFYVVLLLIRLSCQNLRSLVLPGNKRDRTEALKIKCAE